MKHVKQEYHHQADNQPQSQIFIEWTQSQRLPELIDVSDKMVHNPLWLPYRVAKPQPMKANNPGFPPARE
jgi:hypothetical protein